MIRLIRSAILVPAIFLIVFAAITNAQTQQRDNRPRTASISGRVTISGKPAANARVVLDEGKAQTGAAGGLSLVFGRTNAGGDHVALTDADGRYRVANLPEGNYELRVMLKAYISEKEKWTGDNYLVRSISLDEGETMNDVDFSLVPGGVITGRVTDADGYPMISGQVLLQIVNEGGQKQPYQGSVSSQMLETDDRGVYRVYGLRAGRYLVSMGGEGGFDFLGLSGGKHSRTWHPDTDDEAQAKVVEVKEGAEAAGIDIRFGVSKKTFEASGRVIDDATGQPIPKINVMCVKTGGEGESFGGFNGNATTDAQGNFQFNGLTPGNYQVVMINITAFLPGAGENKHYSEPAEFQIKTGDVENVEIKAKIGATISGVAVIEGADDTGAKAMLAQSIITFHSKQELGSDAASATFPGFGAGGMPSMIKGDGSFQIAGIRPGKVTFQVASIAGKTLSVVRVERNGADVSDGIEVKAGEHITGVRVVAGHGTAVIRGQVNVVGGALPEGWRMSVYATNEKAVGMLGGHAQVDGKGRFVIEGLLPGEYSLSLTAMPSIPGANPGQGIEPPAPVTQQVTVASGAEVQVTLTLDLKKR